MEKKLQKIRDKIDVALESKGLDSTKKLKFGCKVIIELSARYLHQQVEKTFIVIDKYGNYVFNNGKLGTIRMEQGTEFEIVETIGRDITLEMCLLAMNEDFQISTEGQFMQYNPETGGLHLTGIFWKPTLPLHLQPKATIDFIYPLIYNDDD